jgi:DNA-binding transcriptional regulator GbsR (MarR family)
MVRTDTARREARRSGAGHDRISAKIRQACDAVGEFIEYWGFKSILGRVWTLMALSNEPMSQIEVAEFLGVSRSLVSGAMHELSEHGLVRPLREHRNTPYEAVVDVWPSISDVLRDREWMLIETARLAIESAVEELELAPETERRVWNLSRMRSLLSMTELAQSFLRLLMGIRIPRRLDSVGEWLLRSSKFLQGLKQLR